MQIKTCPVRIKAAGTNEGTDEGVFEAIVATWERDSVGDKITKGAFADTLTEWKASGSPIPVIWSHMAHDPNMHIGAVEEVEERDDGLWVKGRLDLDNPTAAQVYRLLKGRRVTQFSFSYDILDGSPVEQTTDGKDSSFFELRRLKLYETGPTLIGANQATDLIAVKAQRNDTQTAVNAATEPTYAAPYTSDTPQADVTARPAGFTQAGVSENKNEDHFRQVVALLQHLFASTPEVGSSDDEKAKPAQPAAPSSEPAVEPAATKGDQPARHGTASLRQRLDLEELFAGVDSLTI